MRSTISAWLLTIISHRGIVYEDDAEYEAFAMTLEFRRGENVAYKRYIFCEEDGVWYLCLVEEGK